MPTTPGSLGARVEAYIGDADDDNLSLWLTDGLRHVSVLIPAGELAPFGKLVSITPSNGADITSHRFLYAMRNGHSVRIIPPDLLSQALDPSSLHYVTDADPAAYFVEGVLRVLPQTGTWTFVGMPITALTHTDTVIPNFPQTYTHIVVLYAAVQGATAKVGDALANIPNPIEDPVFDWTNLDMTSLASHFTKLHQYLDTDEDIELAASKMADINLELDVLKLNAIKSHDATLAEWEAKLRKYSVEIQVALQRAQAARLVLDAITATYMNALNAAFGSKK